MIKTRLPFICGLTTALLLLFSAAVPAMETGAATPTDATAAQAQMPAAEENALLPGDADADGTITAADARLILRASVRLETIEADAPAYKAADVDLDGSLSAADARLVLRASVRLEDLSERRPADAALSEQEITDLVTESVLRVDAEMEYDTAHGFGFTIGDGKTMVCRFSLLHHTDKVTVKRRLSDGTEETYAIASVEGIDALNDLALVGLNKAVKPLETVRTAFAPGDTAVCVTGLWSHNCQNIQLISTDAAPDDYYNRRFFSFSKPQASYSSDGGALVLDRFGRVMGIWADRDPEHTDRFLATPAAAIDAVDRSAPITYADFKKLDRAPALYTYESITVAPFATAFVPVLLDSYEYTSPQVQTSRPELLNVTISRVDHDVFAVIVSALKPCKNVPVTVSVHTDYGDESLTFRVTISEEAYLNVLGYEFAPDPGALWGLSPDSVWIDAAGFAHLRFSKSAFPYGDEEMFDWYVSVLLDNGFEYLRTYDESEGWCYLFSYTENNSFIRYHETADYVEIELASL